MEPQAPLDSEACLHPVNILIKDEDCGVTVSSQNHDAHNPAKKQTRQWAAWTRREEESFFTALRQVGKNFEKITFRVQSKNKDQVRHYYYRLVRRMNKLLGPGLFDAKNSKDTNAAMLRWWSLLEKHSCKASKLHLKPRRFKIFIETLENQLLKDRKKGKRKQPSQGENHAPTIPVTISSPGTASGHDDTHAVKLVLVDNQSFKQLGPLKGPSLRRNVNVGINCNKGDSLPPKPVRQRRRPGTTAAYKRWEKAAIAGVSLVADAAEHLERATIDKEVEHVHATLVEKCFDPVGKDFSPLPTSSPNLLRDNNTQASIIKLKLQLFPIDEGTRRALEMDNHNPHLELTLTTRKKISSVLEHLNRKWGNSSAVSGDLMLFPFCVQRENLVGYPRWTQDSVVSAADLYSVIGCPPVFRLRYGWFCNSELVSATSQTPLASSDMIHNLNMMNVTDAKEQSEDSLPIVCQPEKLSEHCNNDQQVSLDRRKTENGAICRAAGSKDDQLLRKAPSLSVGEWADSLTNISVGDLLAEASHDAVANCGDPPIPGSSQCLQQGPFICDSFDAAIAAHINRHQDKTIFPPALASISSSIWDAEETCDAFSFQNTHRSVHTASGITSLEACKKIGQTSSLGFGATVKELTEVEEPMDENPGEGIEDENPGNTDPMDECLSDPPILEDSEKDLNAFADIYWPESLGPLDFDAPSSCRYHTEDVSFSDSLTGLNRLLSSSLDAFQNCSFFGLDKKEMASTVEAQETASFSDFKVESSV